MRKRLLFLVPLAAFVALAAAFYLGLGRDPTLIPSPLIGRPVPPFTAAALLPDHPGLSSSDLKGQVQIVNVFASWCVPCRAEHPLITDLSAQGLVVHGLNWKDKPDDARAWLSELGTPYRRVGSDLTGRAGINLGVYGVPETYVIDADGVVRYKYTGPLQERIVQNEILPLLRALQQ